MVFTTDLEIVDKVSEADIAAVNDGLNAHAMAHDVPIYKPVDLAVFKRDDQGKLVGGLIGKTVWGWLYVELLWVSESCRYQGLGSILVQAAENEARRRGCIGSYLWTEDFEGPTFYPKLGYEQFAVNQDFPRGHQRTGFMKRLAA